MTTVHRSTPEKSQRPPSPADMARLHRQRTGLGAVAAERVQPEITSDHPRIWNPDVEGAEREKPENFAQAGQVFKDATGRWCRWTLQTTRFSTNNMQLPEGQDSFPLTYRGYYSHGFNHNIATDGSPEIAFTGGGWDGRFHLVGHGWEMHGRTFIGDEIRDPYVKMPLDQMIRPVPLNDSEVEALGP